MTEDDLIGKQIDEYILEALLGEGGMARVYRGRDVVLQRYAAIKVITPAFRQEKDYLERFKREARAIARLEHPNVVRLYRYGEVDGLLYMAMQFIEGMDLGSVLLSYRQSDEYLEYPEAKRLIGEIGAALDYIHAEGLVHRDVKSSNIMLDKAGRVHLADFGLVLMADVGTRGEIFGSPHYLAPEQAISSAKAVPQSDLYSLGVIAYEIFTGALPFDAEDPLDIAMLHMSQEPPSPRSLRPDLPAALEAVLLKALAKEPDKRYRSGAALAEAVKAALAEPLSVRRPTVPTSKTIPERVALDLANRPLPPIPAVAPLPAPAVSAAVPSPTGEIPAPTGEISPVAPDTTPSAALPEEEAEETEIPADSLPDGQAFAVQAEIPASAPKPVDVPPQKYADRLAIGVSVGVFLGICVLVGCVAMFVMNQTWLSGLGVAAGDLNSTQPVTAQETPVATPLSPISGKPTPTPTRMSPVPKTPTFTPRWGIVTLIIAGCSDGHCLGIINDSDVALTLARFALHGKNFYFAGNDWDIAELPPGGCLVITGNANKWKPEQDECEKATATLVSDTDFWRRDVEIEYAGNSIGICSKDRDDCQFSFTVK